MCAGFGNTVIKHIHKMASNFAGADEAAAETADNQLMNNILCDEALKYALDSLGIGE